MSKPSVIRIAVLTDIHAFSSKEGETPSWINLAEDQSNATTNPFAGLRTAIDTDPNMRADIVICCGDMGDKGSPEGQQYVWQEIYKLKDALGGSLVLGTAGNHDMDSRFVNSKFDARGQLQALRPPFPIAENDRWLEYWARNFTVLNAEGARFVLLNSSAYHGYQKDKSPPEYLHGRISDRTLDALLEQLRGNGKAAANILVCHHHPLRSDQIKVEDYSEMLNGDRLINALIEAKVGPWLIIHGHKHLPRILYAPGGNVAPIIFSAGSFAAKLYPEYGDKARNEFYIIDLEVPGTTGTTSSLFGIVTTWQWTYGNGWNKPKSGQGLGAAAAFGARVDVAQEAADLAMALKASYAGKSVEWDKICSDYKKLKHLIPEDFEIFLDHLKNDHGLKLLYEPEAGLSLIQVPAND